MSMPNKNPPGLSIGLNMAVGMAVFTYGGFWIDQKRGGGILFTILGIFLGLFYIGYEIWKLIRNEDSEVNRK